MFISNSPSSVFKRIDLSLTDNKTFKSAKLNEEDRLNFEDDYIKDEVQMINDFIEFKLFKNIMKRYKKEG